MRKYYLLIAIFALSLLIYYTDNYRDVLLIIAGIITCVALFFSIAWAFQAKKSNHGFTDFLIGDEGGYSLSRLQAVVWAVIIIGYQLTVIIVLMINESIRYYQLVFSEETLWLLGLSLGSYVSVKGITVDKINKAPELLKSKTPQCFDFISGDNGLDFSKFQMLIWTLIAIFIFEMKCYYHIKELEHAQGAQITVLFNTKLDQFSEPVSDEGNDEVRKNSPAPVPYLPWSFIVLMGLSQGAYIGKKLVPSFKLDDIRVNKETELATQEKELQIKQSMLEELVVLSKITTSTPLDNASIVNLQGQITKVKTRIGEIKTVIEQIKKYKK